MANIVMQEIGQEYFLVYKHWWLNECSCSILVRYNKKEIVDCFGQEPVKQWQWSYNKPPLPWTTITCIMGGTHDPKWYSLPLLSL